MSPRRCCDDGVRCQSGVCAIARSILLQLYAMTGWTTDDGGIIIVASPVPHSPHGSECPVGALPALRSDNLARRSAATLANAPGDGAAHLCSHSFDSFDDGSCDEGR